MKCTKCLKLRRVKEINSNNNKKKGATKIKLSDFCVQCLSRMLFEPTEHK